jgi:hypothetical protein
VAVSPLFVTTIDQAEQPLCASPRFFRRATFQEPDASEFA